MSAPDRPAGMVRSADGTPIACWRLGAGAPVVIVHGGLGTAASWRPVAARLAERFEVFVFDRRGRGHSGDGDGPHTLQREVEDLEAVLAVAGPGAALLAHSYGGAVALEAARRAARGAVTAIVLYEPAVAAGGAIAADDIARMRALLAAGERGAALDTGIAALDAAGLVAADPRPAGARWPEGLLALAPTVPRELQAVTRPGLPVDRYAALTVPALVLAGTRSPAPQRRNCERLAAALPYARLERLDGLGHVAHTAAPAALTAAVTGFLASGTAQRSQPASSSSASGRT
jgi:pimeloyl-ACP methyl ester carboxylesterase